MTVKAEKTLVSKEHGNMAFHVLAQSNALFVDLEEMIPLSEWLMSRADMPDSLSEAFNPEVTEDWGENVEYLCKVEPLCHLVDGVYWRVFCEDGEFKAYHPDSLWVKGANGTDYPVLVTEMDEGIVNHHISMSSDTNKESLKVITSEINDGILTDEKYVQEKDFLEFLVQIR